MWHKAWITGASTDIGCEITLKLAARGAKVAATARHADKLDALTLEQTGITACPADVTDPAALTKVVAEFAMPFIMEPGDATERIIKGLEAGKYEIAFPPFILKFLRFLPNALFFWIIRKTVMGR